MLWGLRGRYISTPPSPDPRSALLAGPLRTTIALVGTRSDLCVNGRFSSVCELCIHIGPSLAMEVDGFWERLSDPGNDGSMPSRFPRLAD